MDDGHVRYSDEVRRMLVMMVLTMMLTMRIMTHNDDEDSNNNDDATDGLRTFTHKSAVLSTQQP